MSRKTRLTFLMLKQFIAQLSRDLELSEPLALQEDGSYSLSIEPQLQIYLRENPESGITLFTILASLPNERTEEFLHYAMSANLLGRETGGGFLSLDKEGKQVTYTQFLPEQMTYKDFHEHLENFVNYAESWQEETSQFTQIKKN